MPNLTLEATIDHGLITVAEPERLPVNGKALLTVLDVPARKPDREVIQSLIGALKTDTDAAEWQRRERAAWEEREQKQRGDN